MHPKGYIDRIIKNECIYPKIKPNLKLKFDGIVWTLLFVQWSLYLILPLFWGQHNLHSIVYSFFFFLIAKIPCTNGYPVNELQLTWIGSQVWRSGYMRHVVVYQCWQFSYYYILFFYIVSFSFLVFSLFFVFLLNSRCLKLYFEFFHKW